MLCLRNKDVKKQKHVTSDGHGGPKKGETMYNAKMKLVDWQKTILSNRVSLYI